MKKTIFILLAALALTAQAETRTPEAMRSIAATQLGKMNSPRLKAQARRGAQLSVLADKAQLTLFAYPEAGWVIVSKDDSFSPVMAYGDSPLDMTNPSPEFLWLMDCYERGMADQLKNGLKSYGQEPLKDCSVLMPVEPLIQTHWAQSWPYNAKCPKVKTKEGTMGQCATGCVATAFAQVFYYHRAPMAIHGTKSYFWTSSEDGQVTKLSYDYDKDAFDWDNMHLTYDSETIYPQAEVNAISNLMAGCGVLANMDYGYEYGSGALTNEVTEAINVYCTDIRSSDHGGSHFSEIDINLIARELNAGRPLVFSGGDAYGGNGHCFVIDGVNDEGKIHCNLGWAGSGDGYYDPQYPGDYSTFRRLNTVVPCFKVEAVEPLPELVGQTVTVDKKKPATTLEEGKWYVLWNEGRSVTLADAGQGQPLAVGPVVPAGRRAEYAAGQMVRLIANNGKYYLQTGLGNYVPAFTKGLGAKTTANREDTYTIKNLDATHFALVGVNNVTMSCDHATVIGAEKEGSTNVEGCESWVFYPATLAADAAAVPVESITPSAAELRLVKGGTAQLYADVMPENASVSDCKWVSSREGYASVDAYGVVTARAKGQATISAKATDGSGVKGEINVYVGTSTPVTALSKLSNTATYTLCNVGFTEGYLIATDTTTAYPTLRGIKQRQATPEWIDMHYWDAALLGDAYTQWQVMKAKDGKYYLYNVGMKQFLVNGEEEKTEYVFSPLPKAVKIEVVGDQDFTGASVLTGNFYLNCGETDRSRLCASTSYANPAHWVYSTNSGAKKQSVWQINELSGLSTGLDLLTAEQLEQLIEKAEGIEAPSTLNGGSRQGIAYDLQGRALRSGALSGSSRSLGNSNGQGLFITSGKKILK